MITRYLPPAFSVGRISSTLPFNSTLLSAHHVKKPLEMWALSDLSRLHGYRGQSQMKCTGRADDYGKRQKAKLPGRTCCSKTLQPGLLQVATRCLCHFQHLPHLLLEVDGHLHVLAINAPRHEKPPLKES